MTYADFKTPDDMREICGDLLNNNKLSFYNKSGANNSSFNETAHSCYNERIGNGYKDSMGNGGYQTNAYQNNGYQTNGYPNNGLLNETAYGGCDHALMKWHDNKRLNGYYDQSASHNNSEMRASHTNEGMYSPFNNEQMYPSHGNVSQHKNGSHLTSFNNDELQMKQALQRLEMGGLKGFKKGGRSKLKEKGSKKVEIEETASVGRGLLKKFELGGCRKASVEMEFCNADEYKRVDKKVKERFVWRMGFIYN